MAAMARCALDRAITADGQPLVWPWPQAPRESHTAHRGLNMETAEPMMASLGELFHFYDVESHGGLCQVVVAKYAHWCDRQWHPYQYW